MLFGTGDLPTATKVSMLQPPNMGAAWGGGGGSHRVAVAVAAAWRRCPGQHLSQIAARQLQQAPRLHVGPRPHGGGGCAKGAQNMLAGYQVGQADSMEVS